MDTSRRMDASDSMTEGLRILRFPDVVRKTGISRTGVYARIRAGDFPEPVSLGERSVGFVEGEVDLFIARLMNRRHEATA